MIYKVTGVAWPGEPTAKPTFEPTAQPTAKPTFDPTAQPTAQPTAKPTAKPTAQPTFEPTAKPTFEPTAKPTFTPSPTNTPAPTGACALALGTEIVGTSDTSGYAVALSGNGRRLAVGAPDTEVGLTPVPPNYNAGRVKVFDFIGRGRCALKTRGRVESVVATWLVGAEVCVDASRARRG